MASDDKLRSVLQGLYEHTGESAAGQCADQALAFMYGRSDQICDISVRILKGGTYKIKDYYLENDNLVDIRGASILITETQESILPNYICQSVGFNCILYNGGGNLCALLPADTPDDFAQELEEKAKKVLVTANVAYYLSAPVKLSKFLGSQYQEVAAFVENQLTKRKKAKIVFDPKPKSAFVGSQLLGEHLSAIEKDGKDYCKKCRKRLAFYMRNNEPICGGCLHKVHAGILQKDRYIQLYKQYTGFEAAAPHSFEEIGTHKGDPIAVVYADGNNMGGLIQHIRNISEMIDFSDFVRETMPKIVYKALNDCKIKSPEITALGGDDIFLLIPADRSVLFAASLIEQYKNAFAAKFPGTDSTLSVGMCSIKQNTPIKVALEAAEDELDSAKKLVRENGGKGSLSFRVFLTYEGAISERGRETLMPYSLDAVRQLLKYAESIRKLSAVQTRLQALNTAFRDAECSEEARLFLSYVNAKETNPDKRLTLPELDGYELNGGFYTRTGNYGETLSEENRTGYIWNDLLYLLKYGGDGN